MPVPAIPRHVVFEFHPRKYRYCVCIFVINEGEKIRTQLMKMSAMEEVVDIIIVDGGSTDGSLDHDFLQKNNVRTLLVKNDVGKLSAQMRMAFAYALDQGYEGIITLDGNNKDNPEAIPLFVQALDQGYDHLQGSRFISGGHEENTPWTRKYAVHFIHAPLMSLSAKYRYTDTTNGFRGYSRKLLCDPRVQPFRDVFQAYELHYYLAIRAAELGFKIKEIPVSRVYPKYGKVPTKIKGWKGNLAIFTTLLKASLHTYNPKE